MMSKLLGLALLGASFVVVWQFESHSDLTGFWRILHWPAIFLTGLGPLGLVWVCYDFPTFFRTLALLVSSPPGVRQRRHRRELQLLHKWGRQYYDEGIEVFERVRGRGLSDFVKKVVERLALRMPTRDIRELLEAERDHRRSRMFQCLNLINLGVRLAPSIGMLGTILGMVRLLANLEDPGQIGPHMSLALLTTFYGLFFSLVIWTPLQQKVERILDIELEGFNQTVDWLITLELRKPINYFSEPRGVAPVRSSEDAA